MYDDLITVQTTLKELPDGPKIAFHSALYNEQHELLNKGVTTLVFYNPAAKIKVDMHPELRRILEPYFIK